MEKSSPQLSLTSTRLDGKQTLLKNTGDDAQIIKQSLPPQSCPHWGKDPLGQRPEYFNNGSLYTHKNFVHESLTRRGVCQIAPTQTWHSCSLKPELVQEFHTLTPYICTSEKANKKNQSER